MRNCFKKFCLKFFLKKYMVFDFYKLIYLVLFLPLSLYARAENVYVNTGSMQSISVGENYTCAITTDKNKSVYCWGRNDYGQLGNNTNVNSEVPVQVKDKLGTNYLTGVIQISTGSLHACALTINGEVYCWGYNEDGQLGNNSIKNSKIPVQVKDDSGIKYLTKINQISVGSFHTCAVTTSETVYCWGKNDFGQAGNSINIHNRLPVPVKNTMGIYLSGISQISAGYWHTCATTKKGEVYCWGSNGFGQLGNDIGLNSKVPVQVKDKSGTAYLTNINQVSAGYRYTCAVTIDEKIYCWGENNYGQLGNNANVNTKIPVQVKDSLGTQYLTKVSQVLAGFSHTCAIMTNGTIYCWGYNAYGQLGNNSVKNSFIPVQVKDKSKNGYLTNVSQASTQYWHTCAITKKGAVYCWGSNEFGQLGNNSTRDSKTPSQVKDKNGIQVLSNVNQISAGNFHTCAIIEDGTTYCWGRNVEGQLGNNTNINSEIPVLVKDEVGIKKLVNVIKISGGDHHTCALIKSGKIYCWGANDFGQLGNSINIKSNVPVKVKDKLDKDALLSTMIQISSGDTHSCALTNDGTAYCWGNNGEGQLGNNSVISSSTPVQVKDDLGTGYLKEIIQIAAGFSYTCAVIKDGVVYCWGRNGDGQLGNDSNSNSHLPVQVKDALSDEYLTGIVQISVSASHTCAVTKDGAVYCWGENNYGQLGNNSIMKNIKAVQVKSETGVGHLTGIVQVSTGEFHTCALTKDKTIYCWGRNDFGQLGNNSTNTFQIPVQVKDSLGIGYITQAIQISAGSFHTCALIKNGSVYCWGRNKRGQLGNGLAWYEIPQKIYTGK